MFTLLAKRSSSDIACARFRSVDEWTLLLICHFRRRHIWSRVDWGSFLPNASRSIWLMVVDNPLSWIEYDVGIPTRLLEAFSCCVKARHSGPLSNICSYKTRPQSPQMVSPVSLS